MNNILIFNWQLNGICSSEEQLNHSHEKTYTFCLHFTFIYKGEMQIQARNYYKIFPVAITLSPILKGSPFLIF